MTRIWLFMGALLSVGLTLACAAFAQRSQFQAAPLPPVQQQWQQDGARPVAGLPVSPDDGEEAPTAQRQPLPPIAEAFAPATNRPSVWLAAKTLKLQALDKVNAENSVLTIKVGQSATFGSLTITVKACLVRPIDQPANAAALLTVTDSHPDAPGFAGWMLQDEPSASMMEHPIYDLRISGCA